MTDSEQPAVSPDAEASGVEAQMQAELDGLRAEGPAPGDRVRNPVFQHEQRAGSAVDAAQATDTAARVLGEMAAEADQERLAIERRVAGVESGAPGSSEARDAAAVGARAERDADEAIAESLDADAADEDARRSEGTRYLHRSSDPASAEADERRALADEAVAARDLSELDSLAAQVGVDTTSAPSASR